MKGITVTIITIVIVSVFLMGCTEEINIHDHYTQATIIEKFYEKQPMKISGISVDQFAKLPNDSSFYTYDYYIRYTEGTTTHVDRVSKEVYASVFANNTYILNWGYINDISTETKDYGYTKVTSTVQGEMI